MTDIEERLTDMTKKTAKEVNEIEEPQDLDILAAKVTTDMLHNILGITLVTTTGGPHIEIDLKNEVVRGYWSPSKKTALINHQKTRRLWNLYATRWEEAE